MRAAGMPGVRCRHDEHAAGNKTSPRTAKKELGIAEVLDTLAAHDCFIAMAFGRQTSIKVGAVEITIA